MLVRIQPGTKKEETIRIDCLISWFRKYPIFLGQLSVCDSGSAVGLSVLPGAIASWEQRRLLILQEPF